MGDDNTHIYNKVKLNLLLHLYAFKMHKMLSSKGKEMRIYNSFKFRKDRLCKDGQKCRCSVKNFTASIFIDNDDNVLKFVIEHKHDQPQNFPRQILSNSVKRKAVDNISSKPSKHLRQELPSIPEELRLQLNATDLFRAK